jgi:hypothetical protein
MAFSRYEDCAAACSIIRDKHGAVKSKEVGSCGCETKGYMLMLVIDMDVQPGQDILSHCDQLRD